MRAPDVGARTCPSCFMYFARNVRAPDVGARTCPSCVAYVARNVRAPDVGARACPFASPKEYEEALPHGVLRRHIRKIEK